MKDLKKKGGSKLFSDKDYGALQIVGMLSDMQSRANKQDLLEADALRSAYGIRGSLADDYEKGIGGSDMVENIGKYMGQQELAKRRDDSAEMLRQHTEQNEKLKEQIEELRKFQNKRK